MTLVEFRYEKCPSVRAEKNTVGVACDEAVLDSPIVSMESFVYERETKRPKQVPSGLKLTTSLGTEHTLGLSFKSLGKQKVKGKIIGLN